MIVLEAISRISVGNNGETELCSQKEYIRKLFFLRWRFLLFAVFGNIGITCIDFSLRQFKLF